MSTATPQEIEQFIRDQYRLWSEDRIDEMMVLFRRIAPNGFTIEYVGKPPQEGEQAMAEMIAEHGGKIRADLRQLIVNGNEAAAVVDNVVNDTGHVIPSIETYRFEDGKMHARYFH